MMPILVPLDPIGDENELSNMADLLGFIVSLLLTVCTECSRNLTTPFMPVVAHIHSTLYI